MLSQKLYIRRKQMDYRRFGNTYLVRMDVGEEIIEQLKSLCRS